MHSRSRVYAHFSQPSSTQDRRLSHHMPAVEGMQDRGRVKVPHSFAGGGLRYGLAHLSNKFDFKAR